MRPELTSISISKALAWPDLKRIYIIIDGLRNTANDLEVEWRKETIRVVESAGNSDSRVSLWLYDDNVGNTNHVLRTQKRALEIEDNAIWLEEDIDLDLDRYSKLQDLRANEEKPYLLTGFSQCNHLTEQLIKHTLFVPLWGMTINRAFYDQTEKIWNDKKFNKRVVEDALWPIFKEDSKKNPKYYDLILNYWINYSEWGLKSSRRWDALANYSLWSSGDYASSSMNRLAHDISHLDFRGMNQRKKPLKPIIHPTDFVKIDKFTFCIECERIGSRHAPSSVKRIKAGMDFKLQEVKKKLTAKKWPSQWYQD